MSAPDRELIEFSKGHGTGNDFVIVADPDGGLKLAPELVARLCDRRRGVGGDGLLRVVRTAACPEVADHPDAAVARWFMDYRNGDGSLAEMCGNGVRVFARYLVESGLADAGQIPLLTRSGRVMAVVDEAPAGLGTVSVELGLPQVYAAGVALVARTGAAGLRLDGYAVDCGNPHLVCALPAGVDLAGLDLTSPPEVDRTLFPDGVNVEFTAAAGSGEAVPGADAHLRMRVHERGVGETLSCGSGACAVAAVALRERGRAQGTVAVDVPGGRLMVTLTGTSCVLAGPAVVVARGVIEVAALVG